MIYYMAKRLVLLLPTVMVPLVLIFLLLHLAPGDPVAAYLGEDATVEDIADLKQQLGFDRPLGTQFVVFLKDMFTFDFGRSLNYNDTVMNLVPTYAWRTAQLTLLGLIVSVLVGVSAGLVSAMRANSHVDRAINGTAIVATALPPFWFSLVLLYTFAVVVRWFPLSGYESIGDGVGPWFEHMVLPMLALGVVQGAYLSRFVRSAMIAALAEPWVQTARAQGLPENRILTRYVLRMAAIPCVTVVGLQAAALFSGAVIIELVFAIPGLGYLLLTAAQNRDDPLIQGIVMVTAVAFVLINLAVDLLYSALDPRVRLG